VIKISLILFLIMQLLEKIVTVILHLFPTKAWDNWLINMLMPRWEETLIIMNFSISFRHLMEN